MIHIYTGDGKRKATADREKKHLDYRLEHDEKFLKKIAKAREEIRKGQYVSLDELPD